MSNQATTDLEAYVHAEGREERVREVREKIDALGITYIYYQFISVTGRVVGKGIPADHWERTADRPGFRFADASGSPLRLSPGSTWVLLANTSGLFPVSRVDVLTVSEGADLLAEARAAAEAAGNGSSAS